MKTWVVANQKGGVGKTTTAVSLAGILADQGKRVLLVDLDPHASLTQYFNYNPDELESSLYNCFVADKLTAEIIDFSILSTQSQQLDLLPSSVALATLDRTAVSRQGMGLKLKEILGIIANQYDYAVIDCPPLLGILMINALAACENLIIPVQTEFLAIKGLERMLNTVSMVYKKASGRPPVVIVPTMYDKRTRASRDSLLYLKNEYSSAVWRYYIPVDTQFRDASLAHQVPSVYCSDTRGVEAYIQLVGDIQKGTINNHKMVLEAV